MTGKQRFFTVDAHSVISWGTESIKDSSTAIVELVKNSYDADATDVDIEMHLIKSTPSIRISDNGSGMAEKDIEQRWLRIGFSAKRASTTSKLNRRKTGEKGIGRISADRLGSKLEIITKTKGGRLYGLRVDWDDFRSRNKTVSEVALVELSQTELQYAVYSDRIRVSGTQLTISGLRQTWTQGDLINLREELGTLVSPFRSDANFRISLATDVQGVLNGIVESTFYDNAVLSMDASYNQETNNVSYITKFQHEKQKRRDNISVEHVVPRKQKLDEKSTRTSLKCGDVNLKLYFYILKSNPLLKIEVDVVKTRQFLKNNAGIRIYRDDIRVKPYGDLNEPGGDWLNLGKRKTSNPAGASRLSFRVAPKQIVGAVFLSRDGNPELTDSAGREGLIHGDGYRDLRDLTLGCLQLLENKYHDAFIREKAPAPENPIEAVKQINKSLSAFLKEVNSITPMLAKESEEGAESLQFVAQELQVRISKALPALRTLSEQNIIYRGLATIGISSAVFGHETETLIASFLNSMDLLKLYLAQEDPDVRQAIRESEEAMRLADSIVSWGGFALARIQRDKRKRVKIDLREMVRDLLDSLRVVFEGGSIKVTRSLESVPARLFPMDVETILINLLTNAYNAVLQKRSNRLIEVCLTNRTVDHVKGVEISVSDSGNGVPKQYVNRIWDPLFTTQESTKRGRSGTGLGLSIVSSIVSDLGGRKSYGKDSKLKGARFRIWLPLDKE
jgi:signal transduction histidine kinase